jgi:23S rRNA (adenine2503-C2)-methyltransferase
VSQQRYLFIQGVLLILCCYYSGIATTLALLIIHVSSLLQISRESANGFSFWSLSAWVEYVTLELFDQPKGIYMIDTEALITFLKQHNQPAYRLGQIQKWVYHKGVLDIALMTDLPETVQHMLSESLTVLSLQEISRQQSRDGQTTKVLVELFDKEQVELVLLRNLTGRTSVCISSQIGCAVGCGFCATGQLGLKRNLTAEEIFDQVLYARHLLSREKDDPHVPTNVIVMGMGEPFHNYEAVRQALLWMQQYLQIGGRRLTVSTAGIIPGIRKFAADANQINLAISLHTVDQELRDRLMPISRQYPLADVRQALVDYIAQTHRKVFVEYIMLAGLNDTVSQAESLARWLPSELVHVNLIRYNHVPGLDFEPASEENIKRFQAVLQQQEIPVTIRHPMGTEIAAACGQLAGGIRFVGQTHGSARTKRCF